MTLPPDLQEKVDVIEEAISFDYLGPDPNDLDGEKWGQSPEALAALAALVERLEAQQAALLMGEVFERRYQRALDEWPPTKAQWEHLESVQSAFLDAYSAALHPEEQER